MKRFAFIVATGHAVMLRGLVRWLQGSFAESTHCSWCGEPLTISFQSDGFDPRSGHPRYERRGDCPRILAGTVDEKSLHPDWPVPIKGGQL